MTENISGMWVTMTNL